MIDRYGNYVKIGGKAYFDDLGINDEELMGELISDEGFVEDGLPYKDTGGTTTIGFGYTKWSLDGKDGRPHWSEYWDKTGKSTGKTMSKEEAEMLMPKVTKIYVDQAKKVIKNKNITPKQFNAIVNLIYRNGIGNVKKSGVIKAINKGDIEEVRRIISENPHLRKSGGKVLEEGDEGYKGITNRNASIADSLIVQTI
jgi:GH24 family phage-related lysozyme (muramidase)